MKSLSERSFKNVCKYCMKIFVDKYKLKDHLGVHTGQFVCNECDKTFACEKTMNKHRKECHVI